MTTISIKIVEVHQPSRSVVIKFASENSAKPLDEYDGIAFTVANFNSLTPQEFIEKIRPQLSHLVISRDQAEKLMDTLDVTAWEGYSAVVDSIDVAEVDLATATQIIPALTNPEVVL